MRKTSNFFIPKEPAFSMQLNGTSLKLIQLVERGKEIHIQAYAHAPLPKDVMNNDAIIDAANLAEFIETTIQAPEFGKVTTRKVAITLPESKSFVRIIQIPKMAESEVENAILFEAESYVPMPMDQVYYDWRILQTGTENMSVLLVASPKETVDSYLSVLESANLEVVAIEVESLSLCRALIPEESSDTALLIDLDSFKTNLIMVEKGNLQFSSSIPIAGNTFTDTIAQALGITKPQAEAIKIKVGINNTPEYPNIRTILDPVLKNLTEEIRNVIRFHYDHSDEQINKIILSGGNARDKSLADYLAGELKDMGQQIKFELGNPWQNVRNMAPDLPLAEAESLHFAATIGLAIRLL